MRPQPQRRIWRLRSPVPEVAESASTPPPKGGQVPAFSQEKRHKLHDLDQDDDDLLDPNRWLRVIDCEPKAWVCPSRFRRLEGIHLHYSRKCITCGATLPNDTCAIYGPLPAEEFDPNLVVPEDSQLPEDSQATQLPSNLVSPHQKKLQLQKPGSTATTPLQKSHLQWCEPFSLWECTVPQLRLLTSLSLSL